MQILQKLNRRDRTQTKLITHCGTRSFRTCRAQIGWTLTVILNTMISLEKSLITCIFWKNLCVVTSGHLI